MERKTIGKTMKKKAHARESASYDRHDKGNQLYQSKQTHFFTVER